jgi:hypothetical protein
VAAEERNVPQIAQGPQILSNNQLNNDFEMPEITILDQEYSPQGVWGSGLGNTTSVADNAQGLMQDPVTNSQPAADQTPTFAQQLTALSLEATAERHLGSTTGLSFATLTQIILRRLTPDKADFVFNSYQENATRIDVLDPGSPSDPISDSFFQSLSWSISAHPLLFGDLFFADFAAADASIDSMAWPNDETHVRQLVNFYFAHSHTLYPILKRSEVMDLFERIHQNPENLATQAPLDAFRIWMVLAIGSTAYSSVTLTEESESMLFYNKALQYSEHALASDEMVRKLPKA